MKHRGLFAKRLGSTLPFGIVLASVLTLLTSAGGAGAQEGQGKYVTQASKRLVNLIGKANSEGFKLQDNKTSIGGGWLKKGDDNWVTVFSIVLEKDKAYRFLAAGDDDAMDVDLQVLDANSKVVANDEKADPEAVVDFTPSSTQQYQIRVRLYASRGDLPCVCLAIVLTK